MFLHNLIHCWISSKTKQFNIAKDYPPNYPKSNALKSPRIHRGFRYMRRINKYKSLLSQKRHQMLRRSSICVERKMEESLHSFRNAILRKFPFVRSVFRNDNLRPQYLTVLSGLKRDSVTQERSINRI